MWPLVLQFARTYAPVVVFPFAFVIGVIGYNMESYASDKYVFILPEDNVAFWQKLITLGSFSFLEISDYVWGGNTLCLNPQYKV